MAGYIDKQMLNFPTSVPPNIVTSFLNRGHLKELNIPALNHCSNQIGSPHLQNALLLF